MSAGNAFLNFMVTAWRPNGLLVLGFVAAVAGYTVALRTEKRVHWPVNASTVLFAVGMLLLLLALLSPLETLASNYLLSAHMLQHLLLAQVIPPLLLLGLPAGVIGQWLARPRVSAVERVLRRPAVGWVTGIGVLWVWHVPAIYQLGLSDPVLHLLQLVSVPLAGLVFFWPVFAPHAPSRMGSLSAVLYLASACLATAVLGMILTFSSSVLYSAYLNPADPYGILTFLRSACGLTPQVDQELSGLLMWVPCCFLYVGTVVIVLARWYASSDAEPVEPEQETRSIA